MLRELVRRNMVMQTTQPRKHMGWFLKCNSSTHLLLTWLTMFLN